MLHTGGCLGVIETSPSVMYQLYVGLSKAYTWALHIGVDIHMYTRISRQVSGTPNEPVAIGH